MYIYSLVLSVLSIIVLFSLVYGVYLLISKLIHISSKQAFYLSLINFAFFILGLIYGYINKFMQ